VESDSQPNLRAPYPSWLSSSLSFPSNEYLAVLLLYSFFSLTLDKRRILQEMLRVLSLSVSPIFVRLKCVLFQLRRSPLRTSSLFYDATRRVFAEREHDGRVRMARESLLVCTPAYRPRRPVFRPYSPTLYSEILRDSRDGSFKSDTRRFFRATKSLHISYEHPSSFFVKY